MGNSEDAKVAVQDFVATHGITTVRIQAPDIDGLLRGKRIPVEYFASSVAYRGSNIANILFGWDMVDELLDNLTYTGWHTGYPDVTLLPDLSTLRVVPWEPGTAMVTCDITELDGTPVGISPREVLKRVVRRAEGLGYVPQAAYEFEFYLFEGSPRELADRQWRDPRPITHGSRTYSLYRGTGTEFVIGEIRHRLHECGIDIEASNSEHGPGQFEVNIHYSDALTAADHAAILKTAVKEIAASLGCTATFMAKVSPAWAGSSGHVHQSLSTLDGTPAFANANDGSSLSAVGLEYTAGLLELASAMTAFYCPTINSFKRTEGGSWAGSSATWGKDNRTVAIRAIPSTGAAARVENRIPGADANPYLVIAANVASGLYGIEQSLTPPEAMIGNAYENPEAAKRLLPNSLETATAALRSNAAVRDLFGADFVEHFALTRDWEIRQFGHAVTDWETSRYMEMI